MMSNITIDHTGTVKEQKTTIARTMDDETQTYRLLQLPKEESKNSLLGNFFLSQGKQNLKMHLCLPQMLRVGDSFKLNLYFMICI